MALSARGSIFSRSVCVAPAGIMAETRNPLPASPSGKPQRVSITDSFGASPSISDTALHQLIRASTSTLPLHSCSHTKPRSTSPSSNGKSSPPTTSPTSTPSNNSYSPSADATNRSPRPSNGSSPTTISTPGSNGSPNARKPNSRSLPDRKSVG